MLFITMINCNYGKCNLWQTYYGKCNYGKSIMANVTEPLEPNYLINNWKDIFNFLN